MVVEYATFALTPAPHAGAVPAYDGDEVPGEPQDFVVDGTPLLLRLAGAGTLPPPTAALGPPLSAAQVRALLPADGAGGRQVIYACPACGSTGDTSAGQHLPPRPAPGEPADSGRPEAAEEPAGAPHESSRPAGGQARHQARCEAISAVVERDGTDVVWRDFARQTTPPADPTRHGYPGIGPFRFRAEEYRAVLRRLLAGRAPMARPRRVLLVGPRVALFARLAATLRTLGTGADITRDAVCAHADEIRSYGAVAFAPAVGEEERAAVRAAFAAAGHDAGFVEAPAPLLAVLLAQVEQALQPPPDGRRRLSGLTAAAGEARVEVAAPCRVRLTGYGSGPLRRTRARELFDDRLEPGPHRVPLGARLAYVVARTYGEVLVARVPG
ncbi:oxidoreductase [Streptomyces sp. NPDC046261]|uniref:oxidoreductase n=1 Tax=Streptomyces sp. NPDC046261 TaxID=3157200 RepID=UPI00340A43F5